MAEFPHSIYSETVLYPAYVDALHYFFEPMLAAHEAHTLMLAECGVITAENATALLLAVALIRQQGSDAYDYKPGIEDLFFRIEDQIIRQAGKEWGGNLQLARSRNDLGQALARMALRTQLLEVGNGLLGLRRAILATAQDHIETLMPGYTHTQPAQPVTFAHYLAGILTFLAKDQNRLKSAYNNVNESPLGAAAFTGTGFPIDRQRVAQLLGFDAVIASTHHSIGAGDHLTDVGFAVQSVAIGLSRVTKDLLFLATKEASALHIDDSFIQISSIMPQKRNPVVLEHLRARLSRAIGYGQTISIQCHNIPYGDTQDIEDEILPPLMAALGTLKESISLYTAFFETVKLNHELLRSRADEGFMTATELADVMVRDCGLAFRQAHQIVATMIRKAIESEQPSTQLSMALLQAAALDVLGRQLELSEEEFQRALDPDHFVEARNGLGGVAPTATASVLSHQSVALDNDVRWFDEIKHSLRLADILRADAIRGYIG
ncbi:MAG: argininosuccinate lyase [Chloroflexota bacterium]